MPNHLKFLPLDNPEPETVWLLKPLFAVEKSLVFADMESLLIHLKNVDPGLQEGTYQIEQWNDSAFFS